MNPLKTYQNLTSSNHLRVLAYGIERVRGSHWKVLPREREVLTKLERLPFLSIGNLSPVGLLQPHMHLDRCPFAYADFRRSRGSLTSVNRLQIDIAKLAR